MAIARMCVYRGDSIYRLVIKVTPTRTKYSNPILSQVLGKRRNIGCVDCYRMEVWTKAAQKSSYRHLVCSISS